MTSGSSSTVTVRSATLADLDQVREISAYYVQNTVINFMYQPPTLKNIEIIFQATKDRNLPYLVAITSAEQNSSEDKIQGYCYCGPFPSTRLAYAHTLELSIFVRSDGRKKGVGSALLRALLESLRLNKHNAFEPGFEDVRRQAYARKLIAKMSYDTNGPERDTSEALRQWYARWGFTEVGTMKDVGYKFGRYVDTMDHILDLDEYYHGIGASTEHRILQ